MKFDDPIVIAIAAVLGLMALMLAGQAGYQYWANRGLHREDRIRRRMARLPKMPIEPRRSDPSHSNED